MRSALPRWLPLAGALACAPLFVPLSPGDAEATVMQPMRLDQMVKAADVIIRGEVLRQASSYGDQGRIYTVTEIKVLESLKGGDAPAIVLKVRQLGGTVDGISQHIAGNARLLEGEEVALFLRRDAEKQLHYVVGMAQGKYAIDRSGPEPLVARDTHGLSFKAPTPEGVQALAVKPQPAKPAALTWAQLRDQIQAAQATTPRD